MIEVKIPAMRPRSIAPTLLMLAAMPMAVGADGVAPVIGAPANTFELSNRSAPARVTAPGDDPLIQIDLANSPFTDRLFYFYSDMYGASSFRAFGMGPLENLGIAIVGQGGVRGTWYLRLGGGPWTELSAVSDNAAQLLALSPGLSMGGNYLGFQPDPDSVVVDDASEFAELTFRAVDDIDAADAYGANDFDPNDRIGTVYDAGTGLAGGSPSPFSAETRTLKVRVYAQNDAPVWQGQASEISATTVFVPERGGKPVEFAVSDMVTNLAEASDPDGTAQSSLGVFLQLEDIDAYTWERIDAQGVPTDIVGLLDYYPPDQNPDGFFANPTYYQGGPGILLGYQDRIRITPKPYVPLFDVQLAAQNGIGTVALWDGSEGAAGYIITPEVFGGSSAFSSRTASISLTFVANQDPAFDSNAPTVVAFNPGQSESLSAQFTVTDSDGTIEDFGGYSGEGIDSTSISLAPAGSVETSWSVQNPGSGSVVGTATFSNLPNAVGSIGTVKLAARDDFGGFAPFEFQLYGNSAPEWTAEARANVAILTVEDGDFSGKDFAVTDPDVENPFPGFEDFLTFGGELGSSITRKTDKQGDVTITLVPSYPDVGEGATMAPVVGQAVRFGVATYTVVVDYVPAPNFSGSDSVEIPIQDSLGLGPAEPLVLDIQVSPVNDAPVANAINPDSRLVVEQGGVATVALSATDPDENDVLTWTLESQPALGTVAISGTPGPSPTMTFTAGQTPGEASLTFRVTDSAGASSTVSLTVNVVEIEVAPVITTPSPLAVTLAPGGSTTLALSAVDPNLGEVLTWSVAQASELVTIAPPQGPGFDVTFTVNASQQAGTSTALLRVMDSTQRIATIPVMINVAVPGNQPPAITAPGTGANLGDLLGGTSRAIVARATDPDVGDTLSWTVVTQPTKGSVSPTSGSGAATSFLYTAGLLASGADSFELQVADGRGGSARVVVNASVTPNTPPDVSTPIGVSETQNGTVVAVAVRGQPFRTLIGGDDRETPRAVAVTITGALPAGIVFNSSGNSGVLSGTPSVAGSFNFSIALDDGVNRTVTPVQLTVIESVTASVASPRIPVSTPDRTAYGSFLPGSAENFSALATALQGRLPSQARAFWWDATTQAYAEVPSLPPAGTEAWHAVWLASTSPITLPSTITAVAMPYAIELAPGWTFFGVPPVTDGSTVITTHAWATFQVQSVAGVPLSANQRADALGNANAGGPFAWDGETYARTTSLVTGAGYWLKNASEAPLRLVRTASASMAPSALRSAAARADEQPPAPPGSTAAQATDSGGGCGAGSGIGLFGLSMAFLFNRLRRRG